MHSIQITNNPKSKYDYDYDMITMIGENNDYDQDDNDYEMLTTSIIIEVSYRDPNSGQWTMACGEWSQIRSLLVLLLRFSCI